MPRLSFYSAILLGIFVATGVAELDIVGRILIGAVIIVDALIYRVLKMKLGEWE